ncbi:MAG: hypothetical protein ACRDWE_05545 [Acidimicrobiales bacterium]
MRMTPACGAVDDREIVDRRHRRSLVGVHPGGARDSLGHLEPALDGEVCELSVPTEDGNLQHLPALLGSGCQRRSPDLLLVHDRGHREDVHLPAVFLRRQPCRRHRAELVEPHRKRQLVTGSGAPPPPLHLGCLPQLS